MSPEEMFVRMRSAPLRRIASDDEEWDELFPEHPLTKVRGYLGHVASTLVIDPGLRGASPYRVRAS
jgi:hypothetical protein